MKNKTVKDVLRYLKRDKIISDGEYQRIWNDYKQLNKKELENLTKHNSSFIQDCFKKVFPEYNEFPEGHRLLKLQKLLERGSPK